MLAPFDDAEDAIKDAAAFDRHPDDERAELVRELIGAILRASLHPLSESAVLSQASAALEYAWADFAYRELRVGLEHVAFQPETRIDRAGRLSCGSAGLAQSSRWFTRVGALAEAIASLDLADEYRADTS